MRALRAGWLALALVSACMVGTAWGQEGKAELPITKVVLFSSGVGYFERAGEVAGGSRVELTFKTEDINDILKSMVVMGAREASVTYGSRDPVAKALKSFAVDITSNPTLGQLLDQLRGAKVRVAVPQEFDGVILGVEQRTKQVGENQTVTVDVLNVMSADGLRSVELPEVKNIRLLEPGLEKELGRALAVLAGARDKNKKPVTIAIGGEGKQQVALGYVVETPVWKTSYRLVLDEKEKPLLQGWAIVENTTDGDWKDVSLSLVSGQPISFIQDLYTPLYVQRQVVRPELYATLRAQAYEADMEMPATAAAPRAPAAAMADRLKGRAVAKKAWAAGRSYGGAVREEAKAAVDREAMNKLQASVGKAGAVAELFEYPIAGKATLERQKSAMFLIVSGDIEAERLSIFDPSTHDKFPLNGLEMTNSTGLYLMQGPITVFDGGIYAGDARITDIPVGDKRLLSYSLDQKREVAVTRPSRDTELVSLKIIRGVLIATRKYQRERLYTINNKDPKERVVLIQYPYESDWTLVEPKDEKPATASLYRFRVTVPGKKGDRNGSERLRVLEEQTVDQRIYLTSESPNTIRVYLKSNKASSALIKALQGILDQKAQIADLKKQVTDKRKEIAEIERDQARTRQNMGVLDKNNPLYAKYLEIWEKQENKLETLRKEIKELEKKINDGEKQLMKDIQALNVN